MLVMKQAAYALAIAILLGQSAAQAAVRVGTVFTYQGQLKQNGVSVSGDMPMEFVLFAAPSGGTSLGSRLVDPVAVLNGLFSVQLDFGASVFVGDERWLEVRVNQVALTPRQKITPTPYALYALDSSPGHSLDASDGSPTNAVFVDASGDVGVGTTSPGRKLDIGGALAGARITNSALTGPHFELKSSSTDTASHTIGALDFIDLADTRLGGMTYLRTFLGDRLILSAGEQDRVFLDQSGRLGIGTTYPAAPLHVEGGTEATLSSGGYLVLGPVTSVNLVMDNNEIQARSNDAAASLFLNPSGGDVFTGGDAIVQGSIGVGTASPAAPLHVTGGTDASPSGGGAVVIGLTSGANIAMDNNEIMARYNGAAATLYLNNDGGDIVCGGPIDIGYEIVHASGGFSGIFDICCPAGKRLLGGGCFGSHPDLILASSYPVSSTCWRCGYWGDTDRTKDGYAICANVK